MHVGPGWLDGERSIRNVRASRAGKIPTSGVDRRSGYSTKTPVSVLLGLDSLTLHRAIAIGGGKDIDTSHRRSACLFVSGMRAGFLDRWRQGWQAKTSAAIALRRKGSRLVVSVS